MPIGGRRNPGPTDSLVRAVTDLTNARTGTLKNSPLWQHPALGNDERDSILATGGKQLATLSSQLVTRFILMADEFVTQAARGKRDDVFGRGEKVGLPQQAENYVDQQAGKVRKGIQTLVAIIGDNSKDTTELQRQDAGRLLRYLMPLGVELANPDRVLPRAASAMRSAIDNAELRQAVDRS